MKKFLLLIMLSVICVFTGCNSNKEKTLTCVRKNNLLGEGFDYTFTYIFYYDDNEYVTKTKIIEKIVGDKNYLEVFKQAQEELKESNTDDNLKYDIKLSGNTLIVTQEMDYSDVDLSGSALYEDSDSIIENGKMKISKIKKSFESEGISCK